MANIPVEHGLALAAILFVLGLTAVLVRRNIIFILMGLEVMLNAVGLAFIVADARWLPAGHAPDGQVTFLFILAVTAAEASVGLALALQLFHRYKTLDADAASRLKG